MLARPIFLLVVLSAGCISAFRSGEALYVQSSLGLTPLAPAITDFVSDSVGLTLYKRSTYGVSFRYPQSYVLTETVQDLAVRQWRDKLQGEQPGSDLLATVTIPPKAYPNTTFRSATLQLVVNPMVARKTCESLGSPLDEFYTSGSIAVQGTILRWRERGSAALGTGFLNRDYAGFSNGICYEFFLEVVVGSNPDADPRIEDANPGEIMGELEKVVCSLQLGPNFLPAVEQPAPIIRSFTVEPLQHPLLQNVIRVSWDVSGAADNEVFLRADCPGNILADLNPLPDAPSSDTQTSACSFSLAEPPDPYSRPGFWRLESIFSCGVFTPVPARSGSFRMQIESHDAQPVSFTLFVFHLDYVTRGPIGN